MRGGSEGRGLLKTILDPLAIFDPESAKTQLSSSYGPRPPDLLTAPRPPPHMVRPSPHHTVLHQLSVHEIIFTFFCNICIRSNTFYLLII